MRFIGLSTNPSPQVCGFVVPRRPRCAHACSIYLISLTWNDNSADEQGFVLRTRVTDGDWDEHELPVDAVSYSTRGPSETHITYAVCAYNALGRSWWSNEVSVDTRRVSNGPGCALILDPGRGEARDPHATDPGTTDDGAANAACVWLCSTEAPTVLDRTHSFGSLQRETLRSTSDNLTVSVLGSHTTRRGLAHYDLELAVFPGDAPVGTTGVACLMLHDPATGNLPTVLERIGYGNRPAVHPLPQGAAMPIRAGQLVPVIATVDIDHGTWSVTAFNFDITRDTPLDAIVTVPMIYVGR